MEDDEEYEIVYEEEYIEVTDDEDQPTEVNVITKITKEENLPRSTDKEPSTIPTEKVEEVDPDLSFIFDENDVDWLQKHQKRKEQTKKWGILERRDMWDFDEVVPPPSRAMEYPFELDDFQKESIYHLERGESVFVAAHTSAGKTVVAEYAIALALKHMTRVVYTSPIKALSNQKFREFKKVFQNVGLITGDVSLNPESSCLVLTTEILRSMLYKGADLVRDIEWVIFDEVHYINDSDRGVVWEEVIIMLPDHVGLIFLSATVPNTFEFADWVGRTKKKNIFVISTNKRPVPLEHYLYCNEELYKIVDSSHTYLPNGYKAAAKSFSDKKKANAPKKQISTNSYVQLVRLLESRKLLPTVMFVFSKNRCSELAYGLNSIDLNTSSEKGEVHVFIEQSLARLKGTDRKLPQVLAIKDLLKRGIGVHHAGLLPIIKEIVEILFSRGLVKVLFATETFAMGVNMPTRTVVFSDTKKHDGNQRRDLLPGEYTQMSGRAGRRGLDNVGIVIILSWYEAPEPTSLQKMLVGKPTKLSSQFRLTYNMILNLLRMSGEFRVEDMIKRSFSEATNQKLISDQEKAIRKGEKLVADLEDLACIVTPSNKPLPMLEYYKLSKDLVNLEKDIQHYIISNGYGSEYLTPGRIVLVNYQNQISRRGVLLNSIKASHDFFQTPTNEELTYQAILITSKPTTKLEELYEIVNIQMGQIARLCKDKIKLTDYGFNAERPTANAKALEDTINAIEQLFIKYSPSLPPIMDPVADLKIKDMDFILKYQALQQLEKTRETIPCHTCPHFTQQYEKVDKQQKIIEKVEAMKYMVSEESLYLKPEFDMRIQVLQKLNYIDSERIVQLKGKVAREVSTCEELIATELIFENVLTPLNPAEAAALISCLVFQEKAKEKPTIASTNLQKAYSALLNIGNNLADVQIAAGIPINLTEYISKTINPGLMAVVYAWANNMSFAEIKEITDVPEGSIVRAIVRLDETCRDFRSAARIVGDPGLMKKMENIRQIIRRDIVFAASLYVG
uniref:Helicase ATP-binding domain-containing protein n=1 Tax=Arcella intermedia TaxID=1963864 RepID=A0A6B2KX65_9EUKA